MAWVVTVLVADMAVEAQVVVLARGACDKELLGENVDAAVAGASRLLTVYRLLLVRESTRDFLWLLGLGLGLRLDLWLGLDLGRDTLGGAVDNTAVLDKALDHPVARARAVNTWIDARRAQVVVATVADTAMEVLVVHGVVAVVAVHDPSTGVLDGLGAKCKVSIVRSASNVVEEALTGSERLRYRSFIFGVFWLRRRHWADGLELGRIGGAHDQRRDGGNGGNGMGRQRLGAHAEAVICRRDSSWSRSRGRSRGRGQRLLELIAGNMGSQAELELCLCSAEERLVDLRLVRVESDVGTGRIGVTLDDELLVLKDLQASTELEGKNMGAEVLEGQLELPGLATEQDLDGDGRVEGDGDRGGGSHGERGRLTT
jgi:hypothetical protein